MNNEDDNIVDDIHQSDGYHEFASHYPIYDERPGIRGICHLRIALGIGADGASMSRHKQRNDFSVLPILVTVYNWPIWFRNNEKHLLLSGVPPFSTHNPALYFGIHIQTYIHIFIHSSTHADNKLYTY
jgi:hypothetical protein